MPNTTDYDENVVRFKNLRPLVQDISAMAAGSVAPIRDSDGEYSNLGLYFAAKRDGLIYQVKVPKYDYSTGIDCIKAGANAGLTCEPSTNTSAGTDDYAGKGPFNILYVNATVDEDGYPHATAVSGDGYYKNDGSFGDCWIAAPVLWWAVDEGEEYDTVKICDTPQYLFDPQPGAKLPDGTLRPYMLYAQYPGVYVGGAYMSASGYPVASRTVSHNSQLALGTARGAGYSGKTHADAWYVEIMFLMKYAKKSSQSVYAGCSNYNCQYKAAMGEEGVKRVILTTAQANNLLVGSCVSVGTLNGDSSANVDRNGQYTYDILDKVKVSAIEELATEGYSAVILDTSAAFDTEEGVTLISSMGWHTGACDNIQGNDGSPYSPTGGKTPFRIQGIELMHGYYELVENVTCYHSTVGDAPQTEVCVCHDSANLSSTSSYTNTGVKIPRSESAAGWIYQRDLAFAGGLPVGVDGGATSSTGTGDAAYSPTLTASGHYELLSLGALASGAAAGLLCAGATNALSYSYWTVAGRLSALGRSAA